MKTAIKGTRRIAAIVLSLALLCGVVVGTNLFVSANETEVSKYAVDFKDLADVATKAGKDLTGGYAATADDTTITAWVNEYFGGLHSWDNGTLQTMNYLGVPYNEYAKYWTITENGLKSFGKGDVHSKYGAALSLKKDGEYLQLKNFEASLVFNTDEYACGSVFISFHEPGAGNVGVHNGSFIPTGDMALAVATDDVRGADRVDVQGVEVGMAGAQLPSSTSWAYTNMDHFASALAAGSDYKLTVKVVNGAATVTVTSVDGSVVYVTKTTTVSNKVGTISIGSTGRSRVLKSIEVTELDKNGNAVDLGTLAAASAENAYTVDFAKLAALVTDEQYGEGTTYLSQETDTAINDWVNARFELNYSGECRSFHDRTYLGQQISDNNVTSYWNIDKNGYLVNADNYGGEMFRTVESLTLKDKNGDLAVLDNFEAKVVFKNVTSAHNRGVVYIAFNEANPGKFVWTDAITYNQHDTVMVGYCDDNEYHGVTVKGYGESAANYLYASEHLFTNPAKMSMGDSAVDNELYIKVVGNDVYVKVSDAAGNVYLEQTFVDQVKGTSGTVSIGSGACTHAIKSISVTELDETGVPVDFGTNNFESTQPQSFSVDFADLAACVEDADYADGWYHSGNTDSASDTAVNAWFNERFGLRFNREEHTFKVPSFLGEDERTIGNDRDGYLQISENGYLQHYMEDHPGAMLRTSYAMYLKKNGEAMQFDNFEATVVYSRQASQPGGVYLAFHQQTPGKFSFNVNDVTTNGDALQNDAVIVGYCDDSADLNYLAVRKAGETITDKDGTCNGHSRETALGNTATTTDTFYKLTVKVVGTTATITLTTEDGNTVIYSGTDTVSDGAGAISVGLAGCTHTLKSIDVVALDANGEAVTDNALIGNDGVVDIVTADGYEVKAGSLIVTDANGNKFVPQRVGFRNNGDASQYQVTDTTAVAPFTVDYEVIKPSLDTPNVGNIGTSYNTTLSGLRFISRFTRTVENETWLHGDYEIVDYGMLATSAPGIAANGTDATAATVMTLDAELAPAGQYVQKVSIKDADKYYDLCDEHADMALTFINIDQVQGYDNPETIDFYARPYVVVKNGDTRTVLYGDCFSSSLADVAPAAQ